MMACSLPSPIGTSLVCTLCTRRERSSCRCLNCNCSLCGHCEQAHKRMLCFQSHTIVPLNHNYYKVPEIRRNGYRNGDNGTGLDSLDTNMKKIMEEISKILNLRDDIPTAPAQAPSITFPVVDTIVRPAVVSPNTTVVPENTDPVANRTSPVCVNEVNSMQIHKTFGIKGSASGQFHSPHGFCLGFNEEIVVADSSNHRIQIFDKSGFFKFQFGVAGRHDGQLWHPRKIAVLPIRKKYVICDRGFGPSRMQLFTEDGRFFKKVYIQFIDIVAGIAVTQNEDVVLVDSVTPTVFIIGQNDFLRSIDCRRFMEEPSDVVAVGNELYVCDFKGHCVVVIDTDGNLLRKIGSKQITNFPNGIGVSMSGDILVGDSHGNFFHVAAYSKSGEFISEFRCPYIKVSRCCGLMVTSEGYIVTVDKNYHHVMVLDTLYICKRF